MSTSTVTFDCKKFKGLRVGRKTLESFVISETDGAAESYAAQRAKAKDSTGGAGGASTTEELIRFSIHAVNGVEVQQPYEAMDSWNARARQFLIAAYRSVNGAEDDELGDFLRAALDGSNANVVPPASARNETSDDE